MNIQPFTKEIVDVVFNNLWQRSRDEAELWGKTIESVKEGYIEMINQPWALSFHKECQSPPAAICYMECIGHLMWRTHFAATEEGFNELWMPISRFLKRISDFLVGEGNETGYIEILSDPRNKKAEEWFNVMGFYLLSRTEKVDKYVKFGKMYHTKAVGHGDTNRGVLCAEVIK
jgi:hypothetical protein